MQQRRMLVVDDSLTSRTLVNLSLKGLDWQVLQAETGANGLSVAKSLQPDVILLDYMLPDMNGNRFCQTLLHETNTQQIPVIVISGKQEGLAEAFAGCTNVQHFLPKPFSKEQIQQALAQLGTTHATGSTAPSNAHGQMPATQVSPSHPTPQAAQGIQTEQGKGLPAGLIEQLGKQLYQTSRSLFEQTPGWLSGQEPATWPGVLARKWITPGFVQNLWQAWLPWYQQQAAGVVRILCIGQPAPQLLQTIRFAAWGQQASAVVQYCQTIDEAEGMLSQGWDWIIYLTPPSSEQGLHLAERIAARPKGERPYLGCCLEKGATLPTWTVDVVWVK